MKNKSNKIGTCCICGKPDVLVTDDHIPPKTIFPKPRPKNTITVAACERCNSGASDHDQSFSVFLSMMAATHHPQADLLFKTRTLTTLNSNKKLKRHILSTAEPVNLTSKSGIIYDTAVSTLWEFESFNSIIDRTIRGLYYYHFKEILGAKAKVEVNMINGISKDLSDSARRFQYNEIGHKGELIYKYFRVIESPLDSAWLFQFYNSLFVLGFTSPI